MDGRRLTFRLAGINNQNFVMRDEQTGSWWQQVTGRAFHGPLAGRALRLVPHDELTFATWRAEQPVGRVLQMDAAIEREDEYASADWERGIAKLPVRVAAATAGPLEPRTVVVGISLRGASKAWPRASVLASGATDDQVGEMPVVLVAAADGRSLRAFDRRVGGRTLTFVRAGTDARTSTLLDLETLSEWSFEGRAVKGDLAGASLGRVEVLLDYWFDWKTSPPGHRGGEAVAAGREGRAAGDSRIRGRQRSDRGFDSRRLQLSPRLAGSLRSSEADGRLRSQLTGLRCMWNAHLCTTRRGREHPRAHAEEDRGGNRWRRQARRTRPRHDRAIGMHGRVVRRRHGPCHNQRFAELLGVSVRTLQGVGQGRCARRRAQHARCR